MTETVEVPRSAFLHHAYELVMESNDHNVCLPEGVETHRFYEQMSPRDVEYISIVDNETVVINSEIVLQRVVETRPASGGGKFDPPINPPETITEDVTVHYDIRYTMDGLGILSLEVV